MLRVTLVDKIAPAPYTVLAGRSDIAAMSVARRSGVKLENMKAWRNPTTASGRAKRRKVAWFKDPDGNVLSVSQF